VELEILSFHWLPRIQILLFMHVISHLVLLTWLRFSSLCYIDILDMEYMQPIKDFCIIIYLFMMNIFLYCKCEKSSNRIELKLQGFSVLVPWKQPQNCPFGWPTMIKPSHPTPN
jgi:hypothetical protein